MSASTFTKYIRTHFDNSWTLFLDRDGVINQEKKEKKYISSVDEFHFLPGALDAIVSLSKLFKFVVVVTNQKGVGMRYMSEKDLKEIHNFLYNEVKKSEGKIDLILACTEIHNDSAMRKPNAGMAYLAKQKLPSINLSKSIMVGNSHSDLLFGRNANMKTVFLNTNKILTVHQKKDADFITDSLRNLEKILVLTIG